MSFGESVSTCLSKYVVWQGRAGRSEYWWFVLAYGLAGFVLAMLGSAISSAFTVLAVIVWLAGLLPMISVTVRRLHDTGRNGAWYWISLVPFVGGLILLIFVLLPSDPGPNGYGPPPTLGPAPAVA